MNSSIILNTIVAWVIRSVMFGTVIMYGSMGEIMTEKSGNLNLGVPGLMYLGAFSGFTAAYFYGQSANPNPFVCIILVILAAVAAAMLGGLIYSFITVTLRANQNVTGLVLTTFGVGIANFFGKFVLEGSIVAKAEYAYNIFNTKIPFLSTNLGKFGEMVFSYDFMTYFAIIAAVVIHLFMTKTRVGLNLRAVGENPATADAAGINVAKYKYLSTCIGAGLSGLGGLYYILIFNNGIWTTTEEIGSLGWLAVALVIFATWRTVNAIWGAYLFGVFYWLYQFLPTLLNINVPADLGRMAPYVVTIIVLVVSSFRRKKENQAPASLGLSYFREER